MKKNIVEIPSCWIISKYECFVLSGDGVRFAADRNSYSIQVVEMLDKMSLSL
jgi:hypothetical protein